MRLSGIPILFCAATFAMAVSGQPAPITPADLEGMTIDARVSMNNVIQRDGREFPVQNHQTTKLTFLAGGIIDFSLTMVSDTPRGRRQGPKRSGTASLGKPQGTNTLGGGDVVWFFEDNTLTMLRTYKGAGGYKRILAFERKNNAITCNARETYVREDGVGRILSRSAIDDLPVVIVSSRMISSTCTVTPKKSSPS